MATDWASVAGNVINVGKGIYDYTQQQGVASDMQTAATSSQVDPFGADNRADYQGKLSQLYNDPDYLQSLGSYQFTEQQGAQALDRGTQKGSARFQDPSKLEGLTDYNTGRAAMQTYDSEANRLASLSGAQFAPNAAAYNNLYTGGQSAGLAANSSLGGAVTTGAGALGGLVDQFGGVSAIGEGLGFDMGGAAGYGANAVMGLASGQDPKDVLLSGAKDYAMDAAKEWGQNQLAGLMGSGTSAASSAATAAAAGNAAAGMAGGPTGLGMMVAGGPGGGVGIGSAATAGTAASGTAAGGAASGAALSGVGLAAGIGAAVVVAAVVGKGMYDQIRGTFSKSATNTKNKKNYRLTGGIALSPKNLIDHPTLGSGHIWTDAQSGNNYFVTAQDAAPLQAVFQAGGLDNPVSKGHQNTLAYQMDSDMNPTSMGTFSQNQYGFTEQGYQPVGGDQRSGMAKMNGFGGQGLEAGSLDAAEWRRQNPKGQALLNKQFAATQAAAAQKLSATVDAYNLNQRTGLQGDEQAFQHTVASYQRSERIQNNAP